MNALLKVSAQCETELSEHEKNGKKVAQRDVGKVMRQKFEAWMESGTSNVFDGLAAEVEQGPYREVQWRGLVKKIVRGCVDDAKALVARRN